MRYAVAILFAFALAHLPGAAGAQTGMLLDDAQRGAIEEFFQKQAEKAAQEQQQKAPQQKPADKTKKDAKTPAKKQAEKPKKPAAPKAPEKGKGKDKDKAKTKTKTKTNGKTADTAKPSARPAQVNLERGQVLPQDLPRRALPKALDSQLGKPASGTQRVIVGDDVLLIERKTGKILDVLADVAKNLGPGR